MSLGRARAAIAARRLSVFLARNTRDTRAYGCISCGDGSLEKALALA